MRSLINILFYCSINVLINKSMRSITRGTREGLSAVASVAGVAFQPSAVAVDASVDARVVRLGTSLAPADDANDVEVCFIHDVQRTARVSLKAENRSRFTFIFVFPAEDLTWQESLSPSLKPAQSMLSVMRRSPYPVLRHSEFDRIGTVTSWRLRAMSPCSVWKTKYAVKGGDSAINLTTHVS